MWYHKKQNIQFLRDIPKYVNFTLLCYLFEFFSFFLIPLPLGKAKSSYTVDSGIEARLLFNFWTFGTVFYSSLCQFLFNKSPNFQEFFSLLFETVFYSKQSSIPEFTVFSNETHHKYSLGLVRVFCCLLHWMCLLCYKIFAFCAGSILARLKGNGKGKWKQQRKEKCWKWSCKTTHMMILSSVNGSTLAAIHRENLI